MSKVLDEIRDKEARRFSKIYGGESAIEGTYKKAWDAAIALELPVKFTEWRDIYCMQYGGKWFFTKGTKYCFKTNTELYLYWKENFLKIEDIK